MEGEGRVLVLSPLSDITGRRGDRYRVENRANTQESDEGEELRTFSCHRHSDVVEGTAVPTTHPKVRWCFSCSLAWNKHLARFQRQATNHTRHSLVITGSVTLAFLVM